MFAYAGAASFPTYQSDMKDRRDFPKAVLGAMISKLFILSRSIYPAQSLQFLY